MWGLRRVGLHFVQLVACVAICAARAPRSPVPVRPSPLPRDRSAIVHSSRRASPAVGQGRALLASLRSEIGTPASSLAALGSDPMPLPTGCPTEHATLSRKHLAEN